MSTVLEGAPAVKRKHNPDLLRAKRAARALNLTWASVTRERDRLRQNQLDQRGHADEARRRAWEFWVVRAGWNPATQFPFWRNGFIRLFGRKIAAGADYCAIRFADETAETVRCNVPEFSEWSTDDVWEFLLSDYPPRESVWPLYELAICRLAAAKLPQSDAMAVAGDEVELPF
jgi:hypothetical protein